MKNRDRIDDDFDDLSPQYDGYVDQAVDYANGHMLPEDAEAFRERMKTDVTFRRVAQPVLDAWKAPPATPDELRAGWADLRSRIAARGGTPPSAEALEEVLPSRDAYVQRVEERTRRNWRLIARIAAVFAFLFIAPTAVWVYLETAHFESIASRPNVVSIVTLPDQSVVQLAAGSELRYLKKMDDKQRRWVALAGEGTFTVTPAANVTFVVETPVANITVLGTRFTVRSQQGSTVVQVEEGRVSVQPLDADAKPRGAAVTVGSGTRVRVTTTGIVNEQVPPANPGINP